MKAAVLALLLVLATSDALATHRSAAMRAEFQRANPCPATGLHRGRCPGYQVDHIKPLKCGGADRPENMQWLTIEAHKEKTRREARICRR